jgi:hypothetical protein
MHGAPTPSRNGRSSTVRRARFYWRTFGDKGEAKGPYRNMASVTLMIARELKREITKRDAPDNLQE